MIPATVGTWIRRRTRTRRNRPRPAAVVAAPPPRPEQATRTPLHDVRQLHRPSKQYWIVVDHDASLCLADPRFDIDVAMRTDRSTLYRTYLGHVPLAEAHRSGRVELTGRDHPFDCSSTHSSHLPSCRSSPPRRPNDKRIRRRAGVGRLSLDPPMRWAAEGSRMRERASLGWDDDGVRSQSWSQPGRHFQ
jgi:hypothetical protein